MLNRADGQSFGISDVPFSGGFDEVDERGLAIPVISIFGEKKKSSNHVLDRSKNKFRFSVILSLLNVSILEPART